MTSPLLLVPRAIQVLILIESLMNLTLPSPIVTLTPPGCQLSALLRSDRAPEPMRLQYANESLYTLGGAIVLNKLIAIAPCDQLSPRWSSAFPPVRVDQAVWQAC